MFKDKQEILTLIKKAHEDTLTKEIISRFEKLKKERSEFYLNFEELEEILKWKLRTQFGRQKTKRGNNKKRLSI